MTPGGPSLALPVFDEEQESLSQLFHENSKLRRYDMDLRSRIEIFLTDPTVRTVTARPFKSYPRAPATSLRTRMPPSLRNLETLLRNRQSERSFAARPITLDKVGALLFCASGVIGRRASAEGVQFRRRTIPSGGGLYPLEIYFIARNVRGLRQGLYHYNAETHALEQLRACDPTPALAAAADLGQTGSAGVVIINAVFRRTQMKYGDRGYRFVLMEVGHSAQNILLAATALGLGAVPIGGFLDDEVSDFLEVDGVEEAPLYLIEVGLSLMSHVTPIGKR